MASHSGASLNVPACPYNTIVCWGRCIRVASRAVPCCAASLRRRAPGGAQRLRHHRLRRTVRAACGAGGLAPAARTGGARSPSRRQPCARRRRRRGSPIRTHRVSAEAAQAARDERLLEAFAATRDRADDVRSGAVGLLRRYQDIYPSAGEALRQVAAANPKPSLRRLAREALAEAQPRKGPATEAPDPIPADRREPRLAPAPPPSSWPRSWPGFVRRPACRWSRGPKWT